MKNRNFGLVVLLMSLCLSARADDFNLAFGIFNLVQNGVDVRASYRQEQSHWQYGYRYLQWTEVFHDPFTGRSLTKTTETLAGPGVNYLFRNESVHSPYAGVSLLNWSRTDTPLALAGASGSASTTDFYFGGGYLGKFSLSGYYDLGMFISPTAKMHTQTAISSTNSSSNFDIHLMIGLAW